MMSGRSKLNFEVGAGAEVKTLKRLIPVELFLAAGIVDGEGKSANRLVFRAAGNPSFYFLFPTGTEKSMKPAAGWLQEKLEVQAHDLEDAAITAIPEDPVTDLPSDPLEG
jgi:hypothetical protein